MEHKYLLRKNQLPINNEIVYFVKRSNEEEPRIKEQRNRFNKDFYYGRDENLLSIEKTWVWLSIFCE